MSDKDLEGETLVQFLSKLQFNAAKWAYMKLHGALSEEDAAAKLFADRQLQASKIELLFAQDRTHQKATLLEAIEEGIIEAEKGGEVFWGNGLDQVLAVITKLKGKE